MAGLLNDWLRMKKVLAVALVLGLFVVGAYFATTKWIAPKVSKIGGLEKLASSFGKSKEEVPPKKSWVTEEWQHSVVLNRAVRVDSPFPLYPGDGMTFGRSNPYVKAYDVTKGSEEGIHIEASLIVVREDAVFDVRRGLKGVLEYLKEKELTEMTEKLVDDKVMGRRSCEFEIQGKLNGQPVQTRGVIFGSGRNGVVICVKGSGTDETIAVVWNRLKSGIRDANAAVSTGKTTNGGTVSGMESGSPQLPPGFTPRNLGTKEKTGKSKD